MLANEVMHVVTNSAQQKAELEAYLDGNDDDDGSDLDDGQYDEAVAEAPSSPQPRLGVRTMDTGEVAPARSIELTPERKLRYDGGEPMDFDGRDDYTSGMERMLTAGIFNADVTKALFPHHLKPERLRLDDRVVEFFSNPALDVWYASTFVCAKHQLFMHPSFGAKARLFRLNNGLLALGDLWSEEMQRREQPRLNPGSLCIGGSLGEIRRWVNEANREGKRAGKKPIEWVIHVSIVEDLLELLGYRHYDPGADAKDFLVLMDAEYPDGSADFVLMKAEKGVGTPEDPHHVIVGCICGYASFGVVAVPVKASKAAGSQEFWLGTCPIQAVRFLASGARGSNPGSGLSSEVFVDRTLFFRAGSRDGTREGQLRDPVMIPYMLCHGRVYERLGRNAEYPPHELEVEHGFTRLAVYYMHDGFWDDPRWKFAPPQAVLAAGGFRVQLPLVGSRMNGERLRGIMLVLNPREGHMADTFLLSTIKSSTNSRSPTSVFQLPSETQDLALTAPKIYDVRVWQATAYHETVGQLQPTLDDQYRPSLPTLTDRQLEASFKLGKVAKFPGGSKPPGSFLSDAQVQEVYYRQGRVTPMIVKTGFRFHVSKAGAPSAADADAAKAREVEAMSKQLEAVAIARQRQAEAEEWAALAEERAARAAAAQARSDKKARKKKEREDYLAKMAKDAPGPSSGTPSREVIEANRIAREERLLALATAERKQKEADAEAEKEAQRAAKAAQQAEQPQLTRQQQVLLNQAAAREKKRLEKEAKAKGGARGQQLPPPPQANVEGAVRRAQLEAMQPAPPRANQRRRR